MGPLSRVRKPYQAAIAVAAVATVFVVRLTQLPGASPYELFLLLNIVVAIVLGPSAALTAALFGLVGANLVIAVEGRLLSPGRYWVMTSAYTVFSGLLVFFNWLGHRVSARARRETRLKHELAASSLDAVVSLDGAGRFVDLNRAASSLFGRSPTEAAGAPFVETIIAPADRERVSRALAGQLPESASILNHQVEMRAVRGSGGEFPIEIAIVRVPLEDGAYFICHIRDITERKAHEEEREMLLKAAERANRIKDELLANVSHELRTPLNAIMGWAAMLRRGQVAAANLKHAAEVIERNAQAQARLVDDLLDASLAAAGRLQLTPGQVDVAEMLRETVDSIRPAAQAQGIQVTHRAGPDLGTIEADGARVQQVLLNLLSNAIKFTPREGEITLDAQRRDGAVTIRVADTGVGIAPDFLPAVFDRFTQGDASTTRAHGGMGLGLAIARHLVELMGGQIVAESLGPGKGAAFAVRLPVDGMRGPNVTA